MRCLTSSSKHSQRGEGKLKAIIYTLILFAGVWLTAAQIPRLKFGTARTIVAGIAFAIGGLLLIIATRWGHFG